MRTALAKPGRENQGATPITLDPPKEITRLKKHVSSVMDRITRGGKIQDIDILPDASPFVAEVTKDDAYDNELEVVGQGVSAAGGNAAAASDKDMTTPVGTRFGESGERIRSARLRSARSSARSSAASRRSRPSTSQILGGDDYDGENGGGLDDGIPPDGPVDLDQLERDLPPLVPVNYKKAAAIESPAQIFPTPEKTDDDIW